MRSHPNRSFATVLMACLSLISPTYEDIILKPTNGIEITRQRVEFTSHSQRTVDIQSLLISAVSPATTGSIDVMQQSPELDGTMAILGQLSMTYRASEQPNY